MNGLGISGRTRNNYRNAVLQLFRYARGKRYLPRSEPTVVEDVASASPAEGAIQIYTPQELRLLLSHAPAKLLPFFAMVQSGLRSQEIMRLDWSDIRFEQASSKSLRRRRRQPPGASHHSSLRLPRGCCRCARN